MKSKIILLFLISICLTGCYNYRELNELAITSAMGIQKENGLFKISVQVLDTEKSDSKDENSPKYVIYNTTGDTAQDALRNILEESSKRLYANHMQVLLIDEDYAEEGINDILDFFFREPELRKQFFVLITKGDVEEILSTETLLEKINAKSIKERTETNFKYLGTVNKTTFSELIADYVNPNIELSLPSIELIEEEKEDDGDEEKKEDTPSKRLFLSNTGVFRDDKLVGYINEEDAVYLNIIKNQLDDTIITYEEDNKYTSIEVIENKTKIKVDKNNITIKIKMEGSINEVNMDLDLNKPESITYIEDVFAEMITNNVRNSIIKTYEQYDSDIYGLKDLIYKNDPDYFKNNNIDLNKLNIDVITTIDLVSKGNGVKNINEKN